LRYFNAFLKALILELHIKPPRRVGLGGFFIQKYFLTPDNRQAFFAPILMKLFGPG